jgi:hypothetical protein
MDSFTIVLIFLSVAIVSIPIVIIGYRRMEATRAKLKGKKIFIKYVIQEPSPSDSRSLARLSPPRLSSHLPSSYIFYSPFPKEQQSTIEKEAEVIIELKWECMEVGHYYGASKTGYIISCTVDISDKLNNNITQVFNGSPPPNQITTHVGKTDFSPVFGEIPTEKIINFIQMLKT